MRTQQNIESDLAKLRKTMANIQTELSESKAKEEIAQREWEETLLDVGITEKPKTLKAVQDRREELNAASNAASRKLQNLEFELSEFRAQERVKGVGAFQKTFWGDLAALKRSLLELSVQLETITGSIQAGDASGIAHGITQDFDIVLDNLRGFGHQFTPELQKMSTGVGDLLKRQPK